VALTIGYLLKNQKPPRLVCTSKQRGLLFSSCVPLCLCSFSPVPLLQNFLKIKYKKSNIKIVKINFLHFDLSFLFLILLCRKRLFAFCHSRGSGNPRLIFVSGYLLPLFTRTRFAGMTNKLPAFLQSILIFNF